MICDYGCGKEAKYQFKNGRWCCSKNVSSCEGMKKKNSNSLQGRIFSKQHKQNLSSSMKGKTGQIPWNKGKTGVYSKKALLKISKNGKGRVPWNKGIPHSKKTKNKISKSLKGFNVSQETKNKISKTLKGRKMSNTQKKQISISNKYKKSFTIKQLQERYPTFSKIEGMRYKPSFEKEKIIQVHCKNHNCKNSKEKGGWFTPKNKDQFYNRIYAIEKNENNGMYFYCSEQCKQECSLFGKTANQLIKEDQIRAGHIENPWYNSQEYQIWRNQVFKLDNNKCVWCGEKATIVHHIIPQKTYPEFALDPENGLSSCQSCHMKYGHRDRWCTTGFLAGLVCNRIIRIKKKCDI